MTAHVSPSFGMVSMDDHRRVAAAAVESAVELERARIVKMLEVFLDSSGPRQLADDNQWPPAAVRVGVLAAVLIVEGEREP